MKKAISIFLLAMAGFLFLLCGSVVLTLNCREIYYRDMRNLQLGEELGLTQEEVKTNYDVLIDYNLITSRTSELRFPNFPMSEQGRIHFEEVRNIFFVIQYLMLGAGIVFAAGAAWKIYRREIAFLKWTGIITLVIPVILGCLIGVCWEQFFVLFHKIFFRNDYWLFDPVTDPVILILPDIFFAHCAISIVVLVVLGSLVCLGGYGLIKYKQNKYRK